MFRLPEWPAGASGQKRNSKMEDKKTHWLYRVIRSLVRLFSPTLSEKYPPGGLVP